MASTEPVDTQLPRDAAIYETNRNLCPVCRRVIEADVFIYGNAVYSIKHRPEHDDHEALISSEAAS